MFSIQAIRQLEAKEARERADRNAKQASLSSFNLYLDIAYRAISEAADAGNYSTPDPFTGLRMAVDQNMVSEVWKHLRQHGYSVYVVVDEIFISWELMVGFGKEDQA